MPGEPGRPLGPVTAPHPIDACYGSPNHCWSHHVDEPWDASCCRSCLECGHVFRDAAELLAAHNAILAELGEPPETDPARVFCCPHCIHDF